MKFKNPWQEQVADFHRKFGQPVGATPDWKRLFTRWYWLDEEVGETYRAQQSCNLPEIADGLIDTIYIALGTLVELGVDADAVFQEVHAANMRKEQAGPGEKIRKPAGWVGPDVAGVLRGMGL